MSEITAVDVVGGIFILIVFLGFFAMAIHKPSKSEKVVTKKTSKKSKETEAKPDTKMIVPALATASKTTVVNQKTTFPLPANTFTQPVKPAKPTTIVKKKKHNVPDNVVKALAEVYNIPKELWDEIPETMWHRLDDVYVEKQTILERYYRYVTKTRTVLGTIRAGVTFAEQELGEGLDGVTKKPKE